MINISLFSFYCSVIICLGYFYVKWMYSFWRRKGIPYEEPRFPFGNLVVMNKTEHISRQFEMLYRKYKTERQMPMMGAYFFFQPVLFAFDLDLVQHIFIKDFNTFSHRGIYHNEKYDPLSAHMVNLEHDQWKPLRTKLTPTFTSGKMKFMFPTIVSVADRFIDSLNASIKLDSELEMQEWFGRFNTDVIGTCAFGIECNSLEDSEVEFRRMGRKVFEPKLRITECIIVGLSQELAKSLGIHHTHDDVTEFFMKIVKDTVSYRETNNIQRNDFMSLLVDMKNSKKERERLTINEIAAHAIIFFLAGFETSPTTLTFCLYELALDKNKHIQEKARREVANILGKHNGNLTYESLSEMTYIEQIINETLRKHPPVPLIPRVATKDYKVPNSHLTIPKGMYVYVPVYAIHHDQEIYEHPEEFDPKRFEPDQVKSRPSCSFLPFGHGPRNCIGLRFGMLQMKIGLVKLLQQFKFSTCPRTTFPVKYDKRRHFITPQNGMWLKVTSIQ